MTHRDEVDRAFGGQLDSLVDLVCGGVAPGFLLLSVSGFNPWFLPGAFALAVAGAIRLAHFNVSPEGDAYSGLPIDTNIVVITLLVGGRGLVGELVFPWLLYGGVLMLAMLNVASFRMPKPTRPWYYAVVAYVISMTALQI
jgi:CDP-diacylglycerol--serine O-phosphatidyltransferase